MSSVRTRLIGIFFLIAFWFLLATISFLLFIFICSLFLFVSLPFSVLMAMSSGASTLSGSGSLWYTLPSLDEYCYDCKDYLDTVSFKAMISNGDEVLVYDACNGPNHNTVLGVWVRH